ncbi:aspartate aminotransferase family protein [Nocardia brasiliensis]|uniref:aspartate aminotransferase family protein n=1 Tax=Nocardia brasiliensis TaxID=37326 RepID=UPI00366B26DA
MTRQTIRPAAPAADVLDGHGRLLSKAMARMLGSIGAPVEQSSSGCHVVDQAGVEYLSCGGYGVFLLGHCHPRVVDAVVAQVRTRPLGSRLLVDPDIVRAAEALIGIAPPGLEHVTFTNSGAEAVEIGLKLARATGRHRIIAMANGFHGKTMGALSVTGNDRYRKPFGALLPGVEHVPFDDIAAVDSALATGGPATVIVEPVQAEGGVRIPRAGYLAAVRERCDAHGALLIVDEIQTGLGRLGREWGCSFEDVSPDILLSGKILGGGIYPVGAALATSRVHRPFDRVPFLHTSTFGGNPAAAAAIRAALAVIDDEHLVTRSAELGELLLPQVRELVFAGCPQVVREVRGRGLLIGIEFVGAGAALNMMREMLRRRVITSYSLNADQVLRLTPPALLSASDVDWLLSAVQAAALEIGRA